MAHIDGSYSDDRMERPSNFRPAMKSLLRSAWNIFKAFIINARDVLGSGRINL